MVYGFISSLDDETTKAFFRKIVSTMRHPYFVKDKGWISAEKLDTTDELLDENWSSIKIQSIVIEELDEPVDTYNFAVAEYAGGYFL